MSPRPSGFGFRTTHKRAFHGHYEGWWVGFDDSNWGFDDVHVTFDGGPYPSD